MQTDRRWKIWWHIPEDEVIAKWAGQVRADGVAHTHEPEPGNYDECLTIVGTLFPKDWSQMNSNYVTTFPTEVPWMECTTAIFQGREWSFKIRPINARAQTHQVEASSAMHCFSIEFDGRSFPKESGEEQNESPGETVSDFSSEDEPIMDPD